MLFYLSGLKFIEEKEFLKRKKVEWLREKLQRLQKEITQQQLQLWGRGIMPAGSCPVIIAILDTMIDYEEEVRGEKITGARKVHFAEDSIVFNSEVQFEDSVIQ